MIEYIIFNKTKNTYVHFFIYMTSLCVQLFTAFEPVVLKYIMCLIDDGNKLRVKQIFSIFFILIIVNETKNEQNSFPHPGAIQELRNAGGVGWDRFFFKKRPEDVRFNVISVTRGWVWVNCTFRMERSKHHSFIFKKGSRNKSVNYRPVSLKSAICKSLGII